MDKLSVYRQMFKAFLEGQTWDTDPKLTREQHASLAAELVAASGSRGFPSATNLIDFLGLTVKFLDEFPGERRWILAPPSRVYLAHVPFSGDLDAHRLYNAAAVGWLHK